MANKLNVTEYLSEKSNQLEVLHAEQVFSKFSKLKPMSKLVLDGKGLVKISSLDLTKNYKTFDQDYLKKVKVFHNQFKTVPLLNAIKIDVNGVIVGGNTRVLALSLGDIKTVPCVVVEEMTQIEKMVDNFSTGHKAKDILKVIVDNYKDLPFAVRIAKTREYLNSLNMTDKNLKEYLKIDVTSDKVVTLINDGVSKDKLVLVSAKLDDKELLKIIEDNMDKPIKLIKDELRKITVDRQIAKKRSLLKEEFKVELRPDANRLSKLENSILINNYADLYELAEDNKLIANLLKLAGLDAKTVQVQESIFNEKQNELLS